MNKVFSPEELRRNCIQETYTFKNKMCECIDEFYYKVLLNDFLSTYLPKEYIVRLEKYNEVVLKEVASVLNKNGWEVEYATSWSMIPGTWKGIKILNLNNIKELIK